MCKSFRHMGLQACGVFLALPLSGCHRDESPAPTPGSETPGWFVAAGADIGLDFVHRAGLGGRYALPQIMGSGGALFDYDLDGDLDLYLINGAAPNRLFRSDRDGVFSDQSEASGLADQGFGMGAAIGDIDNDGDLDLYVTNVGPDNLYRNDRGSGFSNITALAGIDNDRWSTAAAFVDYDRDGWLDLYVVNYLNDDPAIRCNDQRGARDYCGPNRFSSLADRLYRNLGDGRFADRSASAGIAELSGNGLGIAIADVDRDGWPDIFVANDGQANRFWINQGDGSFRDEGLLRGVAFNSFGKPEASMGVATGDLDGDGTIELLLTHLSGETNTLYAPVGNGVFQDVTAASGLGPGGLPYTGFGAALFDADNDGDLDLAVANGAVRRNPHQAIADGSTDLQERYTTDYAEPNQFYLNTGEGRFRLGCDLAGDFCTTTEVSRGLMAGDIDRDGRLDLVVTNANGPARLYHNRMPNAGHWIAIALAEDAGALLGAELELETGSIRRRARLDYPGSYLSAAAVAIHIGLGSATRVATLRILWPDGRQDLHRDIAVDRQYRVRPGQLIP